MATFTRDRLTSATKAYSVTADRRIWPYAGDRGFLLVSKDNDFYQRSLVLGAPPKVIWLRVGNGPTREIAALLRDRYLIVRRFAEDPQATFLTLSPA